MHLKIFTRIIKNNLELCGITMNRATLLLRRNVASDILGKKRKELFLEAWPVISQNVVNSNKFADIPDVPKWLKKVYDYNLQGGKKNRGLTTVLAYEMLESPEKINEEMLQLARVLGWCVELMQAFFVILDDIMDGSEMRRGVSCWYKVPGVGINVINDALLIQGTIYQVILKTYFQDKPYYDKIVDLFNKTFLYTSSGQYLDMVTANCQKNDYNMFTMERYNAIVKYKTAYYSYVLPISLGLTLTGHTEQIALDHLECLGIQIGHFFQVQVVPHSVGLAIQSRWHLPAGPQYFSIVSHHHGLVSGPGIVISHPAATRALPAQSDAGSPELNHDDYIDGFGSSEITGKIGTDIQEAKCSWLAVQALARCNNSQRVVFKTCYGSKEPAHVERIIELYRKLGLPTVYQELESNVRQSLRATAANPPPDAAAVLARAPELFECLFDAISQRIS